MKKILAIFLFGLSIVSGFEAQDVTDEVPPAAEATEEVAKADSGEAAASSTESSESSDKAASQEDDEEREKKPKYDKKEKKEYDIETLGWGSTDQEVYTNYGVILNYVDDFMAEIVENDILSLFYLFDSAKLSNPKDMTTMMHRQVITPVFKELKGLAKFYVFDCQFPAIKNKKGTKFERDFKNCEKEGAPPALTLFRSPEIRKNPYTGEPMKKSQIPFPQGNIDQGILKRWITNNMPDFTHKITSMYEYDQLIKNENDLDINKVILFSNKENVTPAFKALAAEFRDKIRFNIIQAKDQKAKDELFPVFERYFISKFPTIVIEQSYNAQEDKLLDEIDMGKWDRYDTGINKLSEMIKLVQKYARKIQKEETEDSEASKLDQEEAEQAKRNDPRGKKSADHVTVNATNFKTEILDSNDACLVYFTTLKEGEDLKKEYKEFGKLERELSGALKFSVFRMDDSGESGNFADLKKEYKVSALSAGKPVIRFYPNEIKGDLKSQASFGIMFDPSKKENDRIVEEVAASYEHSVRNVQSEMFNNMILQYAKEEQKHVVYYMYDDTDINLNFKAISKHPILQDDCVFWSLHDPDTKFFQGLDKNALPSVGIIKALDPEFKEGEIQQSNIGGKNPFYTIMAHIAKHIGKMDELEEHLGLKAPKKVVKRAFGEIKSNEDFKAKCVAHGKGCGIGLISAMTIQKYEEDNTNEHIQIMADLDASAPGTMFYSWINVTCHPEWLKYLNVDPFQIPSMTYYYPGRELQANHIGKFDKASIAESADRFLAGKLGSWKTKFNQDQMLMEAKDCSASAQSGDSEQSEADRLIEEEIMREIMEEEAEKRKAQEQEDSKKKNIKGSKGKKKKGKKKGKKSSKKEDL